MMYERLVRTAEFGELHLPRLWVQVDVQLPAQQSSNCVAKLQARHVAKRDVMHRPVAAHMRDSSHGTRLKNFSRARLCLFSFC